MAFSLKIKLIFFLTENKNCNIILREMTTHTPNSKNCSNLTLIIGRVDAHGIFPVLKLFNSKHCCHTTLLLIIIIIIIIINYYYTTLIKKPLYDEHY